MKVYWTPGEVAKECGVSTQALRDWEEEIGMTVKRTKKGRRKYIWENRKWMLYRSKFVGWSAIDFITHIKNLELTKEKP